MTDSERYLRRAVELEQFARECFRFDMRQELLRLADDWRQMAEHARSLEARGAAVSLDNDKPLAPRP